MIDNIVNEIEITTDGQPENANCSSLTTWMEKHKTTKC